MIKSDGPYCIVGDDSGHDYIIPESKCEEWYEYDWNEIQPEDLGWADYIDGHFAILSYELDRS